MRKSRILCMLAFCLLLSSSLPLHASNNITVYTLWDDHFLYAAFQVPDINIVSTNTTHMSNPWEDDCVEVFIETDYQRAPNRSPNTFQMSVSAGGGSSFVVGENGQPVPRTIYTFKFSRTIQGTLNNPSDRDMGYIVEMAIPWAEMGGPPSPGQVMGFNVICRMKGEDDGFVSLSPDVETAEDIHVPAKWGSIKFVDTPTIIARENDTIICRKVARRPPLIDGRIGQGEWVREMRFTLTKPEPPPPAAQAVPPSMIEKLSLTHYFYWYQADTRKEARFEHVRYDDGSSALTTHPLDGTGPWFSHDRVQWHKDQFLAIRDAGIDVVIPVYWGDFFNKEGFASKGLSNMTQAMKELKAEGQGFPLVGMFFDTSAMQVQYGEKPDLTNDEVKAAFYGMIRDFFLHVPEEFRATVQVPADKGGYPAYIIVLYTASWFSDLDESFVDYCNQRFSEDFDGARLIWVGHSDFRPKAAVMDGYSNYGAGLGLQFDDTGWIRVAGVGAGYDDTAVHGRETPIRSRLNGDTYKEDWDALMERHPDWVIVDGWNEFHEGSDICASHQFGNRYTDLTRINMLRFNGMRSDNAKFLKHNTPSKMLPGRLYQVPLTIRNAGTQPWYPGVQGVFLTARWVKDGALFAESDIRISIQATVLPGQIIRRTIGVQTVDQDGTPLPEGEYELRWELLRGRDGWFSDSGSLPLCVPVEISVENLPGGSVMSSTLPTILKSGGKYSTIVRLRNEGSEVWNADDVKLQYRWHKTSENLGQHSMEFLPGYTGIVDLPENVDAGRIIDVSVPVRVADLDGTPLPVWSQSDLWTYVVSWELISADGESIPLRFGEEAVKVVADDYGPKFITSDTPAEMTADRAQRVNVTLKNTGLDAWSRGEYSIGYHWYYLDGAEALWEGNRTRLPSNVRPGQEVTVRASVTPPAYDGQYYLVWDLAHGDKWVSTTANTRGNDILVVPVNVTGGRLVVQDLSKLCDTVISSFDTDTTAGDADGHGHTFPAEFLPPLVSNTSGPPADKLWPCGLWTAVRCPGAETMQRISFKYPSKIEGTKNVVSCQGQSIDLKPGKYAAVHLLAFATEDATGDFALAYGNSRQTASVRFSAWDAAPKFGEHTAFETLHRHSPEGDQRDQSCYLNHYILQADPSADLTSIVLPNNPGIRIVAVTLEQPE